MDSKELRDKIGKLYHDYKSRLDEIGDRVPTDEEQANLDKMIEDLDVLQGDAEKAEESEGRQTKNLSALKRFEQSAGRPITHSSKDAGDSDLDEDSGDDEEFSTKTYWDLHRKSTPETRKARRGITMYYKYGDSPAMAGSLKPDELKALSESLDTEGGYTVPVDFQAELIRQLADFTFVRGMATQRVTSRDSVSLPRLKGATGGDANIFSSGATITWGGETVAVTETNNAFENVVVPIYKMRALIKISRDLLDDSAVNIEQEVMTSLLESIGLEEDRVFIAGTGVLRPRGITLDSDITTVSSATASTVKADDLFDMISSLPTQYAKNASWTLARATWNTIRKLKDGMGQYLWVPGIERGSTQTLLGYPVNLCPFMPSVTTGNNAVILGDYKYFRIYDRPGMAVQRAGELYAENDQIGIFVRRRLGATVTVPQAFRMLAIS